MTQPPLLSACGIKRSANGRLLLDDVSLDLHCGERLGLVGPTGCGKSLLLRTLAMLEPIDSGTLSWRSGWVDHQHATAFRSEVIYLHQRAARFEGTVDSVLKLPYQLRVHRDRQFDRAWIVDRLASVGRDPDFLSQPHEQLSGGETQIVALLRAIQLSPKVLLLDEPTSALDQVSTQQIESIVMQWYQQDPESNAFIWVSHDPSQAARVANSAISMRSGKLQTEGSPA